MLLSINVVEILLSAVVVAASMWAYLKEVLLSVVVAEMLLSVVVGV